MLLRKHHPLHGKCHGLNPVGVQIAIQHDPLGMRVRDLPQVAHGLGQNAILPLTGVHVHAAIPRHAQLAFGTNRQSKSYILGLPGLARTRGSFLQGFVGCLATGAGYLSMLVS